MADRHYHLNYKVLYDPIENLDRIRELTDREEEKGYLLAIPYSDLGAFLTPLDISAIQRNAKNFRTSIGDLKFGNCKFLLGLGNIILPHINKKIKTYIDIDTATCELVVM